MNTENSIYFVSLCQYSICDLECCAKSERTFDMSFYDLANNEKLLSQLNLYYMGGGFGVSYTYESRAKWFCAYLAAFSMEDGERHDSHYKKLLTNPTIRLLITNEELLERIKNL